ncbi:helix-turn-helix domain-containing protein [Flavobacterium sp. HSC-61S13]|uniref:helix-turn-helix domain-containing protein n=1 Tax=Flavobacterium sp. HSC-61S13 TaxID=2910963 RepID=UPI00209F86A8|nr:helix-turn-helix domain-containing protein [Flavobacterium sp. HSC-61S13]MCP1996065.1 AraC-like DNA-binding protein [Flavobacterium sp. HSC-61S13]
MKTIGDRILVMYTADILPDVFYEANYNSKGILISLCVKGSVQLQVNLQKTTLKAGDLLTVLPQSIVEVKNLESDSSFCCLLFDFNDISELVLPSDYNFLKTLFSQPIISLSDDNRLSYQTYFDLLKSNFDNSYSKFHPQIIKYLLFSLIGQINVFYQQQEALLEPSSRKDIAVFQFYNSVHQYYMTERSVQFYADLLKLTPKYLTTLIRLRTGISASKVISEMVIIKAKSFLQGTDLPVYEIAHQLHFADATTFCRYFRKHTALSPRTYREQKS